VKKIIFIILFSVVFFTSIPHLYAANNVKVVDYTESVAQNLAGKIGMGFNFISYRGFNGQDTAPALAARFWFDDNVGIEGTFAFSSGKHSDLYYVGGKLLAIVKNYKTLNLYASFFGGFGDASNNPNDEDASAFIFKIGAGLGVEWFVLDHLAVSTECGLAFLSNSNSNVGNSFGVYADWLPNAGIRFYF
jgi:hypothetical protein